MKITQVYDEKKHCSGCTACENDCPVCAINMIQDIEGFLYPKINLDLCIQCGRCQRVCPFNEKKFKVMKNDNPEAYGVKHKNKEVIDKSTSGGAFTLLSDYILLEKGIIYGVGFDENLNVIHKRIITNKERDEIRGSKYVQSDIRNIFKLIKKDLIDNKKVLFTGTPCQVAGLKSWLKEEYSNLFTCDIICHGVPSPLLWDEQKKIIRKKYNNEMVDYKFRIKKNGWHDHHERIILKNKKYDSESVFSQRYKKLFMKNLTLRPACYNCYYSNIKRVSDVTIGDFWGIENHYPEKDDNKGTSLVLINTKKGEKLFDKVKSNSKYFNIKLKQALQPNLVSPTKKPEYRDDFFQIYKKVGYKKVLYKNSKIGKKEFIKHIIRTLTFGKRKW